GDVREPDGRTVAIGDHERAIVVARLQLVVGADHVRAMRAVEGSLRLVDVRRDDGGPDGLEREAVRGERGGIGPDADGGTLAAADADEADARHLGELLR